MVPLGAVCLGEGHPQSSVSATVQLHSPIPISDPQVCRGGEPTEFSGTALDPLLGGAPPLVGHTAVYQNPTICGCCPQALS